MGSHVIDSELFGNQFSSAEMREVFSLESMLKGWIDVEVALAKAESELGIVPEKAAQEIERKGRVERFCTGAPMNVTDLAVGPDGALYFTMGGRGTRASRGAHLG